MTTTCYPQGCPPEFQALGIAAAPSGYAWNVNLNNGNSNRSHQSNQGRVRAVLAGECQGSPTFRALHAAYREARRGKKPSAGQADFHAHYIDRLLELEARLRAQTWHPSPPTCFIAIAPKAREIHAPAFADRVVHHWLVPQLERIYEPTFIHDSFSNRAGKGTHMAVERLRGMVRQVESGQGGGSYLQLDIRNFFNSIHRPTLYELLKIRMERAGLSIEARKAVHALLNYPLSRTGVRWACTDAERAAVPPHKRLENAGPGCGIAIGNLSSQFFANVYLDRLDQFVKHSLKVPRYVRYVDDFVLVHRDAEQLERWRVAIAAFLKAELRLELKADQRLRRLGAGIDFLGYVIYPYHTVVRERVIGHAREKLAAWERQYCTGAVIPVEALDRRQSLWASYLGHFRHARHHRLLARLRKRFPWLPRGNA
jgi:hypothetical protein